jgi:hypothetical protein
VLGLRQPCVHEAAQQVECLAVVGMQGTADWLVIQAAVHCSCTAGINQTDQACSCRWKQQPGACYVIET